jgi:hypothetical protein
MVSRKLQNKNAYTKIAINSFEIMKGYSYPGTIPIHRKSLRTHNEETITNANKAYYSLLPLPRSQSVLTVEEINVYKALVRPVATHRAEIWTVNKNITEWLAVFGEKKVLRRIWVGIKVNEICRKQYNKESMQLFGDFKYSFTCYNKPVETDCSY